MLNLPSNAIRNTNCTLNPTQIPMPNSNVTVSPTQAVPQKQGGGGPMSQGHFIDSVLVQGNARMHTSTRSNIQARTRGKQTLDERGCRHTDVRAFVHRCTLTRTRVHVCMNSPLNACKCAASRMHTCTRARRSTLTHTHTVNSRHALQQPL